MAKVTAPLFGFSASGTIAKAVTFGSWKGVPYARQRVTPANPKTTQQMSTRNTFSAMSNAWKNIPSVVIDVFKDAVLGKAETARNRFIGANIAALRGETDLAKLITSPGTRSAPAIGAVAGVAGAGSGEIDLTYGVPAVPAGWTIVSAHIVAIVDDSPADVTEWLFVSDDETPATGSFTLTGLTAATSYAVSMFLEFERPDGYAAYSASRTTLATSGA